MASYSFTEAHNFNNMEFNHGILTVSLMKGTS